METGITSINRKLDAQKLKESKGIEKMAKAQKKILNSKTRTSLNSAQREYKSGASDLTNAQTEQVKLSKQLVDKSKSLTSKKNDLIKAQAKEREHHQNELKNLQKETLATQRAEIQELIKTEVPDTFFEKQYDVFISHASEDKNDFVEPLTKALHSVGITTWYDVNQIGWGQSIRQSIDKGLINSRFCIIVLSQSFLDKYWTNYELNGIFQKDTITEGSVILPIWHNVTRDEIQNRNLTLTDMLAMNTAIHSTEDIVEELKKLVKTYKSAE